MTEGVKRVEVREIDARKGRGLTAVCAFAADEEVMCVVPDVAVLYSSNASTHCHRCFTRDPSPAVSATPAESALTAASEPPERAPRCCAQCKQFVLCQNCASPARWASHALPCKWFCSLPSDVQVGDTDYLRFLLEYASRVQAGETELLSSLNTLCTNEDSQDEEAKRFCLAYSKLIATHFGPRGLLIDQQHMHRLLLQTKNNSIGFPFDEQATLGWSLHGEMCMLNHSCRPNCALRQTSDGKMSLVALRSIAAEEELFISYVDLDRYKNVADRTRHLLEQYRFLCQCEICVKERRVSQ